jgi:hypothetical protein
LKPLIPNDERYTRTFDKLELLMALGYAGQAKRDEDSFWVPLGAFCYRRDNCSRIVNEIEESIARDKEKSVYQLSGMLGATPDASLQILSLFSAFTKKVGGRFW